eukprot:754582-Hanusia_phi.AAC.16
MSTNAVVNAAADESVGQAKAPDRPRRMTWTAPRGVMSRLSTPFFASNSSSIAAQTSNSCDDTVQVLSPRNHDLLVKEGSLQEPTNFPVDEVRVMPTEDDEFEDQDPQFQMEMNKATRSRERRDSMMKLHSEVQEKLKALEFTRRGSRRRSLGDWSTGSAGQVNTVSDWRRNRDEVEKRKYWSNLHSAIFAFTGAIFACAQNELIIRGTDPQDKFLNVLKGMNTLLTCVAIGKNFS